MSCSCRGWVRKPAWEVAASSSAALPCSTTCRSRVGQWKTAEARGLAAMSRVLVVGADEWTAASVLAYRLMMRIGRLPVERRILS